MIQIVPATREHAEAMVGRLRAGDASEVAAGGLSEHDALVGSVDASLVAWAALEDGKPIALWGLTASDILGDKGAPWLLTGPGVERHKRQFLLESRASVEGMVEMFPVLENWCDAQYGRALRWLSWLGFNVHPAEPWGPLGAMFCRFEMGAG